MRILAVYTVTHGAMVELHSARASADINSANHCIWNAGKIIELIDHVDTQNEGFLDPIVGVSKGNARPSFESSLRKRLVANLASSGQGILS